ncbi:MAG: GspH/FimT family pseudopilin [Aquimonas sp.]|nr:GspH/FimT family pseudopilin [Aquimonas sp.]
MHPADQPSFPCRMPIRKQRGFTLTELVIAMLILSILTAIALPSFTDTLARNRLAGQNNELVAAINLARTLAIQSRAQAGICGANSDATGCAANFDDGFIVWVDENRNGAVDADEVRRLIELDQRDRLSGVADLRFGRRGERTAPIGAASLELRPESCATGKPFVRTLTISNVGTVTQSKGNC